jgi:glycosyltransferase involved in cell wall biosynthesis
MRVGQNPAKSMPDVTQPARVTGVVINYIPTLGGYYADSLELLKLTLTSMRANAGQPLDLLVFDNASCPEVRDFLLAEQVAGNIQYLLLSEQNIGKAGAWNAAFGAAPGEVIAYADADVYFFPGWLAAHLETLEAFPNAGMVTGLPMLTPPEYSTATIQWAEQTPAVDLQTGRFLAWEDFWRHAISLGGDEPKARAFYDQHEDQVILKDGQRYYIGAAHFQFVARKSVLMQVLPIPSNRPMGEVRLLDEAINAAGYLRLSLDQWYAQHMGNSLPDAGALPFVGALPAPVKRAARFWQRGPLRRLLQWIYDKSFEWLYRA